ncbi:hypothetical protein [Gordonia jinghuaiqii]|uniref:hypothetical protein n=1 Tax=Gordonia jinghuaiqii TaxID=2758710 RepID=UPI002948C489|nr:hypothetical protein [Gordonia jinghuaiqii]
MACRTINENACIRTPAIGSIEPGEPADLVLWDTSAVAHRDAEQTTTAVAPQHRRLLDKAR